MVAAPRASWDPTLGLYAWDAFTSLVGCGPIAAQDVDFLNALLDQLMDEYPVDPQRVYIYGYSSGAGMAHRMACSHAERFAGIVAGAGFTLGEPQLCIPSVPISVLQFHLAICSDDRTSLGVRRGGEAPAEPPSPARLRSALYPYQL